MTLMKSWVTSANSPDTPFPLNNLPYGVFSLNGEDARCGVAIGDMILDMDAQLHMPLMVAEYTDFYAGKQHAQNMGAILRGSPDLPANWLHIPIGYNGRASSDLWLRLAERLVRA